ncbi:MAG: hypothetical protein R3F59_28750 [Myxococcota bacterium]
MSVDYEALSRLLTGDLPPDEARALRRRIDTEPDTALAWAELLRLGEGLAALPDLPPPPALDRAVLGEAPRRWPWRPGSRRRRRRCWRWGRGCGVRRRRRPSVVLVAGDQWVDGQLALVAGDVPVRVDGRARISVEPRAAVLREPGPQEVEMDGKQLVGAAVAGGALGALLTVAVYEGTAEVGLADGPVVVAAGQTQRFDGAAPAPRPAPTGTLSEQVQSLQQENDALRQQLAEAQFTGAVARGQVAATQGDPVPWTDDVPAAMRPEAFEALLKAEVAKHPGFVVQSVECSEFPCVTTILGPTGGDWKDGMRGLAEDLSAALGDDVGTWMGMALAETDQGSTGGVGLAFAPAGELQEEPLRTRLNFRGQSALHDLSDQLEGDGGGGDGPTAMDVLEDVDRMLPGQ